MNPKYFFFPLCTLGFLAQVSLANAQSIIQERRSKLNHQHQALNFLDFEVQNYSLATENPITSSPPEDRGIWKIFISEPKPEITVPKGQGETIQNIRVRFVDQDGNRTQGKTKPDIILREFALDRGDIYDTNLAKSGLEGVNDLAPVQEASLTLEPVKSRQGINEVLMIVTVEERSQFFFSFTFSLKPPTALEGSARPVTVEPISNKANGLFGGFRFGVINLGGNNQALSLGISGGENSLGFDLDYRKFIRHDRGYAVNFFNNRNVETEFDEGENDVDLVDGSDPWVHRLGGGVEYFHPLGENFQGSLGVTYQIVSVRNDFFSDELNSTDALGNSLTVSEDGQDELLTVTYVAALDRRNQEDDASEGFRLLMQTDQSIPVGDASILYNRLSANYTQYLPVPLFGFTEGDRTLILNLQGGTILGDAPSFEAFSLGGSGAVRGYDRGELATGRSFVLATAEYRFPMFTFRAIKGNFKVGGTLFFDYGTDLGSDDDVIGQPGVARDKPGDGFGYGLGLRTQTPAGLVKLEFALNDQGDGQVIFNIGDRF